MATFKTVSVTYSDGTVINTCVNPKISDKDIKKYFEQGRPFNIGTGVQDNVQTPVKVELTGIKTY